jgi:hypothetical protein
MENQRSLTAKLSRTQKSKTTSLIRQGESSSSINTARVDDQKDTSATYFVRSCPFRIENIDRHAIIK